MGMGRNGQSGSRPQFAHPVHPQSLSFGNLCSIHPKSRFCCPSLSHRPEPRMRGCSPESSAAAARAFESGVLRAAASWDSSSRGALPCKMLSSTWVQRALWRWSRDRSCAVLSRPQCAAGLLGGSWGITPCERLTIQVASGQVASKTRSRTTSCCTQLRKPALYLQSQPGRGPLKVSLVGRHCCLQYPSRRSSDL